MNAPSPREVSEVGVGPVTVNHEVARAIGYTDAEIESLEREVFAASRRHTRTVHRRFAPAEVIDALRQIVRLASGANAGEVETLAFGCLERLGYEGDAFTPGTDYHPERP